MKLAELLAALPDDELDRLVTEHIRGEEPPPRPRACLLLENSLRSIRFLQDFIYSRQPPTFAMLAVLLEADGSSLATAEFREAVTTEATRLVTLVDSGEVVGRDDQLRLYRKVLYQARRNDLEIDASETALLAVLRRELKITQVEHFLLEHHSDLREFWDLERSFLQELHALRSVGLVFAREGRTLLAEDVAPLIRQALGIDMASRDAARLYAKLPSSELAEALTLVHAKLGGTKEERVQRLVTHMVQPREVLRCLSLPALRDVCRDAGGSSSGSKEELIERIVTLYGSRRDQVVEKEVVAPPIEEPRHLDEARFKLLFGSLRGSELSLVLGAFPEVRQSGTKEARAALLWDLKRAEVTLLSVLPNRDLEQILSRLEQKIGGSKRERVDRIVEYFARLDPATATAPFDEQDVASGTEPSR